jgi:5-methylcytosine-specific restriction protein A
VREGGVGTILCRIVWADEYKSKNEHFFAGNMSYPAKHKIAHELLNFSKEKGFLYGFVENKGDSINLSKLGASKGAEVVENITVVWCALDELTRRLRVVGWYDNALVYREPQHTRRSARGDWKFQFKAKAENTHLIPTAERFLEVPMKASNKDKGFIGQRNWFYPESSPHYSQFLEAFSLLQQGRSDEPRRGLIDSEAYQEGQRIIAETTITVRNPKLVASAKRRYGLRCQVCDFSFEKRYGELGKGFIEVHHLVQLASSHAPRKSTTDDVRVVCANCHRMIHKKTPPVPIDELKKLLS